MSGKGRMQPNANHKDEDEIALLDKILQSITSITELKNFQEKDVKKTFTDRFEKAFNLLEKKAVKKYFFRPSLRVIWAVQGKAQIYQVIPASNYCSCDDYYFRAMNDNRRICYHIIAQKLASTFNKYEMIELTDSSYTRITKKWRPRKTKSISF